MILFHSVSSTFIWISLQLVSHIHLQLRLRECCSTSLPSTYLVACTGTILPLYLWASISLICSDCDNEKLCLYLPASSDSNCINPEKEKNIFSETLYVRHWTFDTYVTPSSSFCFTSQKCSSVKRVLTTANMKKQKLHTSNRLLIDWYISKLLKKKNHFRQKKFIQTLKLLNVIY